MINITPEQARTNAENARRSTEEFISAIDQSIDANSRVGERRIVYSLSRALAVEGQSDAVTRHYQQRGFTVEPISVTGHAWTLQIGW